MGNPTSYYNGTRWTFGWEHGRKLATATNGTNSITYTYGADGLRHTKTVDGVLYTYYYEGSKLQRLTVGDTLTMDFIYDANGLPYAIIYNGVPCYYVLNQQGDVVQIVGAAGKPYGTYTYDAWGNILSQTNNAVINANPLRYRGYVYDTETGLYYVSSRYYDPEIGRFINADILVSTGQGLLGNNMFAYCRNNPVRRIDITGTADVDCYDNDPLDEEDILKASQGGGAQTGGNSGYTNGSINSFGYGRAPKQGTPGSTYTQYSSDGKNSVVSQTTYNQYGLPGQRIDYGHSHGSIGAPHVHVFSYTVRDGHVFRNGENIYEYRIE